MQPIAAHNEIGVAPLTKKLAGLFALNKSYRQFKT